MTRFRLVPANLQLISCAASTLTEVYNSILLPSRNTHPNPGAAFDPDFCIGCVVSLQSVLHTSMKGGDVPSLRTSKNMSVQPASVSRKELGK